MRSNKNLLPLQISSSNDFIPQQVAHSVEVLMTGSPDCSGAAAIVVLANDDHTENIRLSPGKEVLTGSLSRKFVETRNVREGIIEIILRSLGQES
jgi:hypothetical protein